MSKTSSARCPTIVDKYYDVFNQLIKYINNNQCLCFVGAGLSINKGYRSWEELIHGKSSNGELPGLIEVSGIVDHDFKSLSLPQIVDLCIEKMPESTYTNFIKNEYKQKSGPISENHIYILKTNFRHVITTNFDSCLYDNSDNLIETIITFPDNRLKPIDFDSDLEKRTLYHIHGRVFLTKNEPEEKVDEHISHLIFGEKAYQNAYQGLMLPPFIFNILMDGKFLFFSGFSWNDNDFRNAYETIAKSKEKYYEQKTLETGKLLNGFALMEYPKNEYELVDVATEDEKKYNQTLKKALKKIDEYEQNEKRLNDVGIKVIGYDKKDNSHSGLTEILHYLSNTSSYVKLFKPSEIEDASVSAFTLES